MEISCKNWPSSFSQFFKSPDGVYLWLDEVHKVCNERSARMFGLTVEEWRDTQPFLGRFVAEEDQELFSWNYLCARSKSKHCLASQKVILKVTRERGCDGQVFDRNATHGRGLP